MSEKLTVERIFRDPIETKFGPGIKTSIYFKEHEGIKMSSFKKVDWVEGDVVMVDVIKKGQFVNFQPAAPESEIEARVKKLEAAVFGQGAAEMKTTAPKNSHKEVIAAKDVEYDDFQ